MLFKTLNCIINIYILQRMIQFVIWTVEITNLILLSQKNVVVSNCFPFTIKLKNFKVKFIILILRRNDDSIVQINLLIITNKFIFLRKIVKLTFWNLKFRYIVKTLNTKGYAFIIL